MISEVPSFDTYGICNPKTFDSPILYKQCSFGMCTTKWTLEYLTEQIGDQDVVIHESSSDRLDFLEKNFNYRTCKFKEFSQRLLDARTQESPSYIYLRSTNADARSKRPARIDKDFPVLHKDLAPPKWVPHRRSPLYHSSVLRIASEQLQIWTHFDLYDNVLCQTVGTKRVVLFPPEDTKYLYVEGDKSRVNCLDNLEECFEKFPLVKKAHIHTATLNPGECLFIPALWWHNIRSVRSDHDTPATAGRGYTIGFNIFWRDQELASRAQYAEKDVYGNKNLVPYDAALTNVDRAVQHLDKLPEKYRKLYKLMLLQHIQKKLNLEL